MQSKLTCSKTYIDLPFAHRQHTHDGHCALIHGHNWSFRFTFACNRLSPEGFVIDFGKLKWLRAWLEDRFDHTLVLNMDDPWLEHFQLQLEGKGAMAPKQLAKIVLVPNCGAEGLAVLIMDEVNALLGAMPEGQTFTEDGRGVRVIEVVAMEDSKNYATIQAP